MKVLNSALSYVVRNADISKPIAKHLIGKKHTPIHRKTTGAIIAIIGVIIAKSAGNFHMIIIHIALDVIGYGLHAVGLIPFLSTMEHVKEEKEISEIQSEVEELQES